MSTVNDAIQAIMDGHNVEVLGGGGRGKSTMIKTLSDFFGSSIIKVGPTGTSAIQMNGQTAHRTFSLSFEPFVEGVTLKKNLKKERAAILKSPDVQMLILDEIGATRVDKFQEIDYTCRKYRDKSLPFGGLQVVVLGDYLQLPPVVTDKDKSVLVNHYNSPFAFDADAYKQCNFKSILLTKNFRQEKAEQQKILDYLRLGENTKEVVEYLNQKCYNKKHTNSEVQPTILAGTNKVVDKYNHDHIQSLSGKLHTFNARIRGDFKEEPAPKTLHLKVGAKILMTCNDEEGRYSNGSGGIVRAIHSNIVEVLLDNGEYVIVEPKIHNNVELYLRHDGSVGERVIGTYTQIPLRIGASVSIHRSQGMTLSNVNLVLPKYPLFGDNMLYVACSRCKDLDNLSINRKLNINDVKTNQYAVEYFKSLM